MKSQDTIADQQIPLSLETCSLSIAAATAAPRKATRKPRSVERSLKNERLMRRAEVQRATGLSRSTLYRKIAANDFPAPIQLSEKSVAWIESEVASWIAQTIAASRGGSVNCEQKPRQAGK